MTEQGEWVIPELINGWTPVTNFSPPQYRIDHTGSLVFRGYAEASDYAFPAFQLSDEYKEFFEQDAYDWGHMDEGHQLHVVRYSIDWEGFVYMEPRL